VKENTAGQDYQKTLKEFKKFARKWRSSITEMFVSLRRAKTLYGQQEKQWKEFCEEIGLDSKAADKWLRNKKGILEAAKNARVESAKKRKSEI